MGWWGALTRVVRDVAGVPAPIIVEAAPRRMFAADPVLPVDQLLLYAQSRRGLTVVGRDQALGVAAVQRARNQVCSIASLPIHTYRGLDVDTKVHPLLRQIDPNVANVVTLAATLEDLLFDGVSWWRVTAQDFDGYPLACRHLPLDSVSIDPPATSSPATLPSGLNPGYPGHPHVWIDGIPVDVSQVIRFDSPNPGLLQANARSIWRAILLDRLASTYANNPRPLDWFEDADDPSVDEMDEDAIAEFLEEWKSVRSSNATAKIPSALKYNPGTAVSAADLNLVELQRQVTLEIANGAGVDPEDLGLSTTSRTYFNAQDRRISKINETYAPYMSAICGRLSMGDVTRRGYTVRFDLTDYLKADVATQATVAATLIGQGVMTADEARPWFNLSGPAPAPSTPAPAGGDASTVAGAGLNSTPAAATFNRPAQSFVATSRARFAVDRESRTIRGLALPYGPVGEKYGQKIKFSAGALEWSDVSRVKHFIDHVTPVGKALELENTPDGLMVALSVMPGERGDQLLESAQHGVYDGLSVGIDYGPDDFTVDRKTGDMTINRATLREVSTTAIPVFDDARVTSVAASRTQQKGPDVNLSATAPDDTEAAAAAAVPTPTTFTREQLDALGAVVTEALARHTPAPPATEPRPVVDPTRRPGGPVAVTEALPYRFRYEGGRHIFASGAEHDFSTDLIAAMEGQQRGRDVTAQLGRINGLIKAAFANVDRADTTDSTSPHRYLAEAWQPQTDYSTPLWDMVAAGTTDGTKFDIPKFSSSGSLVGPATEETEPAGGTFVATLQTITPTQVWGKVEITRQAWRTGGNPALSGIIWDQMLREYYEDRENAVATFLNTLTAATDITLTGTPAATPDNDDDQVTVNDLEAAIALLQFARGGNQFRAFAVHIDLYKVLARVKDDSGRPLYPMINPQNSNGSAANLFGTLNVAGTTAVPSWALGATGTAAANSWLFDPSKVRGWASAPERLFWDFGATVQTANIPQLSFVTMGIYGDVAFGNTDIAGVRQVIFDPSV